MKHWLFSLLVLCACSGLSGQGYERIVDLHSVRSYRNPIGLPDGSVLLRTRELALLDDVGEVIYEADDFFTSPTRIDTLNGKVHAFTILDSDDDSTLVTSIREDCYSYDGQYISDTTYVVDSIAIGFAGSADNQGAIRLHDDGALSYLGVNRYMLLEDDPAYDSLCYFYFNQDREILHERTYSIGARHTVIGTHRLSDNSLTAIIGVDYGDRPNISAYFEFQVVRIDVNGTLTIIDSLDTNSGNINVASCLLNDQQLLTANWVSSRDILFSIYDLAADTIVSKRLYPVERWAFIRDVTQMSNGNIAVFGSNSGLVTDPDFPLSHAELRVFRPDLSLLYKKRFYLTWAKIWPSLVREMPSGDLLAVGFFQGFQQNKSFIARITPGGTTYPNNITGRLTRADTDCGETSEEGLADWWLRIEPTDPGRDTLYTYTDANGNFSMRIDTGGYRLRPVPPNAYWGECPPQSFRIERGLDTLTLAPTATVNYDCPLLTVGINSRGQLDRCEENTYVANYQNRGSQASEPGLLRITLDSFYNPLSSVPDWDRRDGDTLFYNIPSVAVWEEGRIVINGTLDCEETMLQQTHCTEAHIFPDSLCTPAGVNWDGSSIEVNGFCTGDSIIFELRNITPNNMLQEQQYVIVEDLVLHLGGRFQLEGNERQRLAVPANGATYTLLAEQSAGHPGNSNPTVSIEGCGVAPGGSQSFGVIGQYPDDDGDPFVDISCVQNDGSGMSGGRSVPGSDLDGFSKSFDEEEGPFSLDVSPTGFGTEHLIDTSTTLTYRMTFTNEGPDTLIRLLFIDTLAASLDVTTLVPGPGSWPYRFSVTPFGVVRFEMKGVEVLPGEAVFLSFQVGQAKSTRPGTIIRNRAGVTYQGRAFILSNEAVLKVRKPIRYGSTINETCVLEFTDLPDYFRSRDTVQRPEYDSITINLSRPVPAYAIRIDSTVSRGDSVLGIRIVADIELTDSLRTSSGCDSLITFVVMVTTANRNINAPGTLSVYPNPAQDFVVVPFPVGIRSGEVTLMDVLGRKQMVYTSLTGEGVLLDLRHLSGGAYVVSLAAEGRRWTGRLVVK